VEAGHRPKLRAEELFRGAQGYLALELWGKEKDLSGCVRPQFFTRSGEGIELPAGFAEAVKAVTVGSTCLDCSHPHYSRLVAPPPPSGAKENLTAPHDIVAEDSLTRPAEDVDEPLVDGASVL
jgi:hypothetical protein